jgi:enamine deaminase RidA (YjgF/YER057c/UK114 family)
MIRRTLPWSGILHEVVEHGDTLYLAGLVADDPTQGIEAQSESVMAQLDRLLTAHGSDLTCLLQVTIYMTNLAHKAAFNAAWMRWIGEGDMPGRATIGVAALNPGELLELVAIAAKAPKRNGRKR